MTDRELLEMAAKAAGKVGEYHEMGEGMRVEANPGHDWWNPLTDDGDALRLAVKLELFIQVYSDEVVVDAWLITPIKENYELGTDAATRRAIVRAAAAIGSAMS